jgi:hypothetical protein
LPSKKEKTNMASMTDIHLDMHSPESSSDQVTVSWRNLKVTPKRSIKSRCKRGFKSRDILKDLNGIVRPGEMVALMGAR